MASDQINDQIAALYTIARDNQQRINKIWKVYPEGSTEKNILVCLNDLNMGFHILEHLLRNMREEAKKGK